MFKGMKVKYFIGVGVVGFIAMFLLVFSFGSDEAGVDEVAVTPPSIKIDTGYNATLGGEPFYFVSSSDASKFDSSIDACKNVGKESERISNQNGWYQVVAYEDNMKVEDVIFKQINLPEGAKMIAVIYDNKLGSFRALPNKIISGDDGKVPLLNMNDVIPKGTVVSVTSNASVDYCLSYMDLGLHTNVGTGWNLVSRPDLNKVNFVSIWELAFAKGSNSIEYYPSVSWSGLLPSNKLYWIYGSQNEVKTENNNAVADNRIVQEQGGNQIANNDNTQKADNQNTNNSNVEGREEVEQVGTATESSTNLSNIENQSNNQDFDSQNNDEFYVGFDLSNFGDSQEIDVSDFGDGYMESLFNQFGGKDIGLQVGGGLVEDNNQQSQVGGNKNNLAVSNLAYNYNLKNPYCNQDFYVGDYSNNFHLGNFDKAKPVWNANIKSIDEIFLVKDQSGGDCMTVHVGYHSRLYLNNKLYKLNGKDLYKIWDIHSNGDKIAILYWNESESGGDNSLRVLMMELRDGELQFVKNSSANIGNNTGMNKIMISEDGNRVMVYGYNDDNAQMWVAKYNQSINKFEREMSIPKGKIVVDDVGSIGNKFYVLMNKKVYTDLELASLLSGRNVVGESLNFNIEGNYLGDHLLKKGAKVYLASDRKFAYYPYIKVNENIYVTSTGSIVSVSGDQLSVINEDKKNLINGSLVSLSGECIECTIVEFGDKFVYIDKQGQVRFTSFGAEGTQVLKFGNKYEAIKLIEVDGKLYLYYRDLASRYAGDSLNWLSYYGEDTFENIILRLLELKILENGVVSYDEGSSVVVDAFMQYNYTHDVSRYDGYSVKYGIHSRCLNLFDNGLVGDNYLDLNKVYDPSDYSVIQRDDWCNAHIIDIESIRNWNIQENIYLKYKYKNAVIEHGPYKRLM